MHQYKRILHGQRNHWNCDGFDGISPLNSDYPPTANGQETEVDHLIHAVGGTLVSSSLLS